MARRKRRAKRAREKKSQQLYIGIAAVAVLIIIAVAVLGSRPEMVEPMMEMEEEMPEEMMVELPPPTEPGVTVREPQLQITSVTVRPTTPRAGDTVSIFVSVKNAGVGTAQPTNIVVIIDGEVLESPLRSLTQGEAQSTEFKWTPPEAGDYFATVEVEADPSELVVEDNFASAEITVV